MILFDTSTRAATNPQGLIQQAWVKYKGNTNWPQPGAAKYLQAVILANKFKDTWALDSRAHWDSLFVERTYGPVVATQQAYDLDSDVFYLSDWVYILRTDGNTDRFQVVHPEQRNRRFNAIGMVGSDSGDPIVYLNGVWALGAGGLVMNFQDPFQRTVNGITTNSLDVGGTIQVGCYAFPKDYQNPSDKIVINNPDWLMVRLAAELARNDPAKQDQFDPLMEEADDLYQKMILDNQGNSYQQPNGPMYQQQQSGITWAQF